jgi:hypothetical protein
MSTTEKTPTGASGLPTAAPLAGEPDAVYVDPDLSLKDSVGTLPAEEQAWHDAREAARDEGVATAETQEKENIEKRQEALDEQAAKNEELQEVREKVAAALATGAQPVVNIDV